MPSQPIINSTTQQFLDIFDITNNFVIMKDGTTSVIISVDAMNFGLLAEEEQDSIMYAYAGLLNSINYPIQILIRSQTKDVTNYLQLLKEQELAALDRGKQKRIQKYREFVGDLIRERNVLDKKFFVIIPAAPVELGILAATSVLPGKGTVQITSVDRNLILEKAKNVLEPKKDHLIAQFARIGLYSRQLETQEIIQLFYLSYNPEASEGQQIAESSSYTTPLVGAQVEGAMNSADLSGGQGVSTDSPIADVTNMSIDQLATPSLSADAKFEEETVAHNSGNSARLDTMAQPEVATTQQDQNSVVQNTNEGQQI